MSLISKKRAKVFCITNGKNKLKMTQKKLEQIPPSGSYSFEIEPYFCDFHGEATPSMLMYFLLHTATRHAEERGFGYSSMLSQNRAWVLSKVRMKLLERARSNDRIEVSTWVEDFGRLSCKRHWAIRNEEGELLLIASSIWAVIDLSTRRLSTLSDLDSPYRKTLRETIDIPSPSRLVWNKNGAIVATRRVEVCYNDVDINGHLNSVRLLEYLLDVFEQSQYQQKQVVSIELNYHMEGYFGDKLEVLRHAIDENQDSLAVVRSEDMLCVSKIEWEKRSAQH